MSVDDSPLPKRARPSAPGRRAYTDEPVIHITATFLAEAEQAWRDDAARCHCTLGAFQIELSRLYLDPEVRELVLSRVRERSKGKLLDGF